MISKEELQAEIEAAKARSASAWSEYLRIGQQIKPLKDQQDEAMSTWASAENQVRVNETIINKLYANS